MLRNVARLALIPALLAVSGPACGGDGRELATSPFALPAVTAPAPVSDTSTCASACQARHDKCRISTKGGPDCDSERQRCLQACLVRKAR